MARRRGVLHLAGLGECGEQRLPLGDLRHLRRRRKTFQRRREDVVRLDRAVGRLIELRRLERGLQTEAARALLARDRDGGAIGFLAAGEMFGIGLQQDAPWMR